MAKQSKRTRKFEAKGGVKARLEKGTITNKGRLKRKRKGKASSNSTEHVEKRAKAIIGRQQEEERMKRLENDFTSEENLGNMNLDSFFESVVDKLGEDGGSDKPAFAEITDDETDGGDDTSDQDSVDTEEDSGDSDDEDVDAAAERMQKEMEKLQQSDPEFHKFLSKNEQSLLEFEADDGDDGEQDEDAAEAGGPKEEGDEDDTTLVDAKVLKRLEQGAFKSHGVKALKKLVRVYKVACHMSDDADEEDGGGSSKYRIESSAIFDRLMVLTMQRCHEEFRYHLVGKGAGTEESKHDHDDDDTDGDDDDDAVDVNKPIPSRVLMKSPRWKDMRPIVQSFFRETLHVLMEAKEPKLLTFILKALSKYVPFLTAFEKVAQHLLKTLTGLWSAPLDSSEDYQVVRLNAFLRIRQMALTQPFPFIEDCLKKTYLAYAKRAKFGTSAAAMSVLPTLTFMGNCVVELYSLDYHSSYQHAFVYVRQLALHLRSAMQKKSPEAFQVVYCWQYMHCLKLWVAVLCSAFKQSKDDFSNRADEVQLLESLVFPLTEVIFGVIRLLPTTRYLPLRLHCVRFLQQLAATTSKFIPTTAVLLEALDLKELYMKPKHSKNRGGAAAMQLALSLRLPKESPLRTSEQLEACISEIFLLLNREADLYRYSAGFPEFTVRICQRLRKFSKECRNARWRTYARGCIDLCEKHASFVVKERASLAEAPKDVKRLEILKPHSAPSMGDRHDTALSKEKRLETLAKPVAKTAKPTTSRDTAKAKAEKKSTEEEEAPPNSLTEQLFPTKKKKEKKTKEAREADMTAAMEEEDEVKEGIDWSDAEQDEDVSDDAASNSDDDEEDDEEDSDDEDDSSD